VVSSGSVAGRITRLGIGLLRWCLSGPDGLREIAVLYLLSWSWPWLYGFTGMGVEN
jgi:hypothetical protein